jgi:hypothetical protein
MPMETNLHSTSIIVHGDRQIAGECFNDTFSSALMNTYIGKRKPMTVAKRVGRCTVGPQLTE